MLKFSCEKALLQAAAATASRAVAAKSSIPALEGLLLEGGDSLTLSGYNTQTGIRTRLEADVREEGHIVLNARLFGDIIRRMPDDMIVFSADEKLMVHLSCGDASFDILGLSADDYPELPEVDDQYGVAIQQKTLKAMIGQPSPSPPTRAAPSIPAPCLRSTTAALPWCRWTASALPCGTSRWRRSRAAHSASWRRAAL